MLLLHAWRPDVVDFEDHPDELGGERNLLLLSHQRLDHVLHFHVCLFQSVFQCLFIKIFKTSSTITDIFVLNFVK